MKQKPRITASEGVFGFAGWLTTRKGTLRIGAKHEAGTMVELVGEWCKVNKLPYPRKIFPKNIHQPISDGVLKPSLNIEDNRL